MRSLAHPSRWQCAKRSSRKTSFLDALFYTFNLVNIVLRCIKEKKNSFKWIDLSNRIIYVLLTLWGFFFDYSEDFKFLNKLLKWKGLSNGDVNEVLDALPGSESRPICRSCFSCLTCWWRLSWATRDEVQQKDQCWLLHVCLWNIKKTAGGVWLREHYKLCNFKWHKKVLVKELFSDI